ncbi:thiamine pyrophosphate-binding protein [Peristeroidobacter soli]|uniref:thiamine pyrophosphate-binding protein n=1 Tax=Peristeroidobacter soli TaxID=2497877 RepID=UPI001C379388|nr:thiamine pyrophosphate-binding protein [Peristeroidobacter soli]
MKIHERIVELIQAEDVDTIFGIPDPGLFGMFMTAEARGMKVIAPHHEQAGALMADGVYRLTGKPAVLGVNKGPGVANMAAGAIYLAKENVPAIFVMGQRHRLYEQRVRRGKMQYLSQPKLFEGAMKYVGIIEYPEQVDEIVHEAFRRALSGVPGPVYIELPLSVMQADLTLPPAPAPHRYRLVHQRASDDAINDAVAALKRASHPILLVGQGAFVSRAHREVAELARKLACPVIQTTGGQAVIEGLDDRTFPYGSAVASEIVAKSDAVVAIGTELGEPLHYGRGRHWSKGNVERQWIYIERDPTAIGVNRPIDVPLVGDLRDVVPQLSAALKTERKAPEELPGWSKAHAAQQKQLFDSVSTTSTPIHGARLAVESTRVLPKDAVIVRDGGASSMYFGALMHNPPRDLMWNSNYGAVGPGLPYAIGAQVAVGNSRRVVLLTGDSSILFHISELETAVRKNLPVICIVAVDYAWGIEVASYKANFGPDCTATEAKWNTQVRLDKTAESFGAHGEYVEKAEDIGPAVTRALESGKPALIHVVIDKASVQSFSELPGFAEFRTWYGEEGDNLGVPAAPAPSQAQAAPITKGSGY